MALADYFLCDVCERKTFYDANLHYGDDWPWRRVYRDGTPGHVLPWGAAKMVVLCADCAKTHDIKLKEVCPDE